MTTAQDQQSRADFEAWATSKGIQLTRDIDGEVFHYPLTKAAWAAWQAARSLPAPENVREGEPYDNPAFEDLARTMGVWGTAQAALCAQFFLAGHGAQVAPLTDERIRQLDDATKFHESHNWSVRFARAIEAAHGIKEPTHGQQT